MSGDEIRARTPNYEQPGSVGLLGGEVVLDPSILLFARCASKSMEWPGTERDLCRSAHQQGCRFPFKFDF